MNLCQLNTFFSYFLASLLHTHSKPAKKWGKSDQLAEVHLYPIYFLQNPYFSIVFPWIFEPSTMPAMTQRPREKWTTAHFSCLLLYFTQLASYKSQQRGGGYSFWIFLKIFDSIILFQYNISNKLKLYQKFMKKKVFFSKISWLQPPINGHFEKNKHTN